MKISKHVLLISMALGVLATCTATNAADKSVAKHKLIEINAQQDRNVKIMVGDDGNVTTLEFTMEELKDDYAIEQKLAGLDENTRETVMEALEGVMHMADADFDPGVYAGEGHEKVIIKHQGAGNIVHMNADKDIDYEFVVDDEGGEKVLSKHIIIGDANTVLKGHTDAVVGLINKGEFSQEELDKIQAAIDAKR